MKAILVVDLPNNVNMDRVVQTPVALSFSLGDGIKQIMFADGYLKPLPEQMTWGHSVDYIYGWNECLEEITGETE